MENKKKHSDLTGMKFGKWEVLGYYGEGKWTCKCECGTVRNVIKGNLTYGDSKSCGCDSKKDKLVELHGKRFGMLEVIKYEKEKKKWLCKCDCGNTVYKRSWDLRNGKAKSCGCTKGGSKRRIDLLGKKVGTLTVIEYIGDRKWKCICDCGRTTIKTQTQLKNENVSCGCMLNQNKRKDLTGMTFGKLKVVKYNTYSKYLCICECGNYREVSTSDLLSGKVTECTECTAKRVQKSYEDKRIDLTGQKFGDLEVLSYIQNKHKWKCRCSCGKEIEVYGQHLRVGDTHSCGCKFGLKNSNYRSYLEVDILSYIKSIYNKEIVQNHRGILGDNKEVDIYIPDLKLGIEVNGIFWHNDDAVSKDYHQNKCIRALENEVRLVHIYEYEWRNNQDVIKRYLKSLLSTDKEKIYARNTQIVSTISNEDVKEFLVNNHLQGYARASINLGLIYNNKLVALMTFGKPRFDMRYQFELIRLAFDSNVSIVGGTSKLFKYFIDKYKPESIISYCNIDKFNGNVYNTLGFKKIKLTKPNYIWVNKRFEVLTRYQTQKHELVKKYTNLSDYTEDEIMKINGYYKIYNSGNLVFDWRQE